MGNRIFKLSGNYCLCGSWEDPDPSFVGKIVVKEDGNFVGYCDELYDSDTPDINRVRYLVGYYDEEGICFYKLSNYAEQMPLLYADYKLESYKYGAWGGLSPHNGQFSRCGAAHLYIIEEPFSSEEEARILRKYGELNKNIGYNFDVLDQGDSCKNILEALNEMIAYSDNCPKGSHVDYFYPSSPDEELPFE
ncbi:hypothetical protein IKX64_02800 [Candidatus Saccharibacteria bacterium]|nr:hypothetical protein [Candidatus Saccharibacteria bacterium]